VAGAASTSISLGSYKNAKPKPSLPARGWNKPQQKSSWNQSRGCIANGSAKILRNRCQGDGIIISCIRVEKTWWVTGLTTQSELKDPERKFPGRRNDSAQEFRLLSASPMIEITHILSAIEQGDPHAAEQLLPLVYDELRQLAAQKLAQEKPGQTLQATALVHEAYLRLVASPGPASPGRESGESEPKWNSRGHFFAAAAEAMRRILVNKARDKGRQKRGGGRLRVNLDDLCDPDAASDQDLLDLDEALDRLAAIQPQCVELVKLRFFAGLTMEEAAAALGLARRSADRQWAFARAWLFDALSGS
jgi:RNA polymerase sigma factor (TIGR02999 family)